jgi:HK97 gp10 family phage protein
MSQFQEIARYDIAVKKITEQMYDALELCGQLVEDSAKLLVPVDTGNLRGSITHKLMREENEVRIGTAVEYAPYIEFGTGEFAENGQGRKGGWFYVDDKGNKHFTFGNKSQPFLRPALYNNKSNIDKIFKETFKSV